MGTAIYSCACNGTLWYDLYLTYELTVRGTVFHCFLTALSLLFYSVLLYFFAFLHFTYFFSTSVFPVTTNKT